MTLSVHPRACGEHRGERARSICSTGSSPRLRGTHPALPRATASVRFIPAPAGNTNSAMMPPISLPVHPRACGEHSDSRPAGTVIVGSSPRLRGTLLSLPQTHLTVRFIPAPAGNTRRATFSRWFPSVHPRACGEHLIRYYERAWEIGSSPRLRGTRTQSAGTPGQGRFIPAPAGNTFRSPLPLSCFSVHPRACGEHRRGRLQSRPDTGSSPRLRGTRQADPVGEAAERFIPAPAGNTFRWRSLRRSRPVHPRACGEHQRKILLYFSRHGSSPRLRGTLNRLGQDCPDDRFIPAPAGNTGLPPCACRSPPVHPRACGEHGPFLTSLPFHFGSSPRLRGTRWRYRPPTLPRRFIPAPAGNTPDGAAGSASSPVHPRACGEHYFPLPLSSKASWFIPAPAGNTSLMSRTLRARSVHPRACGEHGTPAIFIKIAPRFIPAPAGNTKDPRRRRNGHTVHPRACGEHTMSKKPFTRELGSSPRLRGTQVAGFYFLDLRRFIPAPAGNTKVDRHAALQQSVHPRACGEHPLPCRLPHSSAGSSPRLRGTLSFP